MQDALDAALGGAAVVLVREEKAAELGVTPKARILGYAVTGVDPNIMGIGPVTAINKVLDRTGVKLEDVGVIELNEAFAAQSLAVIRTQLESEVDARELRWTVLEQLGRMDEIVAYQLSRAATSGHQTFAAPLPLDLVAVNVGKRRKLPKS